MARFYSGSDEARKRNKEKMYTRSRRTRGEIEEEEEAAADAEERGGEEGRRREGSSKLLYLGPSPLSGRPGRYYFSETTSLHFEPDPSLFFSSLFPPLPPPPPFSFPSRLADFYDSNDRTVNE